MYVIKRQQLFPEGDPVPFRGPDGRLYAFQDKGAADRAVTELYSDQHNKGWRFLVEFVPSAGDKELEGVAEDRAFMV